jgi:excisionase family DNA binding protein
MEILMTGVKLDELLEKIGQLIDSKLGKGFQPLPDENQSKYVSRAEVAKLLRITLPTLHDWTKQGWLKAYKMGSRVLYKLEEVQLSVEKLSSIKYKKGGYHEA